jgi:hypothetical protein
MGYLTMKVNYSPLVLPLMHKNEHQTYSYRIINSFTIAEFQNQLSYENWNEIFGGNDVNLIFNSFLNIYLRIFNSSFPIVKKYMPSKKSNITGLHQV